MIEDDEAQRSRGGGVAYNHSHWWLGEISRRGDAMRAMGLGQIFLVPEDTQALTNRCLEIMAQHRKQR